MYEWVLFLHVLSAFVLVGALTALWVLVLATRPSAPAIGAEEAMRFGRLGGPLVGVGMTGTLVFGVWLAIQHDRYQVWDGWILAALVLWALAGWAGSGHFWRHTAPPCGVPRPFPTKCFALRGGPGGRPRMPAYAGSLRPCLATPCTRQKRETIT